MIDDIDVSDQDHTDRPEPAGVQEAPTRRPSYSHEAEQSVLGAVLLDNTVMDQITDILVPEDFYVGAHRVAYQAMLSLLDRGDPADPVLLKQYLEKNNELNVVGGAGYFARLMDTVPTTANVKAYAHLVRDKATMRALAHAASTVADEVYRDTTHTVEEMLDRAEQQIFSVGENRARRRSNYTEIKSILPPIFERLERLMSRQDLVTGVPTGFTDLDRLLSGLQRSDLLILAGRPAMGKTSLVMNMAANAALDHQTPVAVFSLEMSKEQLTTRMLASTARVDAQGLRTGRIRDEDYNKLVHAAQDLSRAPLFIDDSPDLTIMSLRAKARRLKREQGIRLLIVDYLQLMQADGDMENRVQEISQISRGLKGLAKELDIPVLALSQLSRKVEERPNKRPILSDLRESGSIEQDADIVLFVYREEVYKENDPSLAGLAEVIIAKQRNGPTGTARLTFSKQFTRFDNHASAEFVSGLGG
ncbi:Replicative DNA helicase [Candidatus Magnetaquicoccaceae bacterium FCR-1]|uniref:Replicative DNA helicase n=1 Tax=Candidatus Magnetaquiglobus chichijimensis TaxID=3141448 RepID=A0ABQ0CCL2_9PROT